MSQVYGHVPDVRFGDEFTNRNKLMESGVHAPSQAGIHGDAVEGAYSICLSGGYEDNEDSGNKIIYVGSGGQDKRKQQTANQSFDDPRNQSLLISSRTRRPVRVVRGKNKHSYYAPASGYRYDGLYVVNSAWEGVGKEGFKMCFFELTRIVEDGDGDIPTRRLLTGRTLTNMLRKARKN